MTGRMWGKHGVKEGISGKAGRETKKQRETERERGCPNSLFTSVG